MNQVMIALLIVLLLVYLTESITLFIYGVMEEDRDLALSGWALPYRFIRDFSRNFYHMFLERKKR